SFACQCHDRHAWRSVRITFPHQWLFLIPSFSRLLPPPRTPGAPSPHRPIFPSLPPATQHFPPQSPPKPLLYCPQSILQVLPVRLPSIARYLYRPQCSRRYLLLLQGLKPVHDLQNVYLCHLQDSQAPLKAGRTVIIRSLMSLVLTLKGLNALDVTQRHSTPQDPQLSS
ncbi:hypothetical protein K438DRAFT_2155477, partial [Mycena galopus ATCC 62051]